jgi:hypothetical protein
MYPHDKDQIVSTLFRVSFHSLVVKNIQWGNFNIIIIIIINILTYFPVLRALWNVCTLQFKVHFQNNL